MATVLFLQGATAALSLQYDESQSLLVDACIGDSDCQSMSKTRIDTTLSSTWVFSSDTTTRGVKTGLPTFDKSSGSWENENTDYLPTDLDVDTLSGENGTATVQLRSIGSSSNVASASTTVGVLSAFSLCEGRVYENCLDNTNACEYAKNASGVTTCMDKSDFTYTYSSAVGLGPKSDLIGDESVVLSVMDMKMTWGVDLTQQINPKEFNFTDEAADFWTVQINYLQIIDDWTGTKQNIWTCNQDCGNCTAFIDTASHDITMSATKYGALQGFFASCNVDGAKIDCKGYAENLDEDGRYMPSLAFQFQNQDDGSTGRVNISRGYIGQPTTCDDCLAFSSSPNIGECNVGLGLKFLNRADLAMRRYEDGKMGLTFVQRAAEYPNKNNLPILWIALAVVILVIVAVVVKWKFLQIPPAQRRDEVPEEDGQNFRASLLAEAGPDGNQGMVQAGTGGQGSSTSYNSYNAPRPPQDIEAARRGPPPSEPAPPSGGRAAAADESSVATTSLTKDELREARLKKLGM